MIVLVGSLLSRLMKVNETPVASSGETVFILVLNSAGLKTIFKFQIPPKKKALNQLE
jgi:hypothetical protein